MNYILDFKNEVSQEVINSYISRHQLEIIKTYNNFDKVFLVNGTVVPFEQDILENVQEDSIDKINLLDNIDISALEISYSNVNLSSNNDWWKVAVLKDVDFDQENQTINRLGSRITIYLVDSGVNTSHSEFAGTNIQNLFSFNNNFDDNRGHGTALASVMTGSTCGISNAKIKVVKIFDTTQSTLQSDMLSAFDVIADDFLQNGSTPSIINLSWTISKNNFIESKINSLIDLGLIIICAAGNSGVPISNVTPASMSKVIKVGAFNQNLDPCDFSNYQGGSIISVTEGSTNFNMTDNLFGWAPGEMIYSANRLGGYGYSAGTSLSSAIASAILAHNIDYALTDDKKIGYDYFEFFQTNRLNLMLYITTMLLFTRKNILNLSLDYSEATNRVSTLVNKFYTERIDTNLNELRFISLYDMYFKLRLVDGEKYNQIEYPNLLNISNNLFIDNGFLYGVISNINQQDVDQHVIPVILRGPNQPDQNLTITITLTTSRQKLEESTISISSVNPNLDISLLDDSCCVWNGSNCTSVSMNICYQDCAAACGGVPQTAYCAGYSKFGCSCLCDCGFGPETVC